MSTAQPDGFLAVPQAGNGSPVLVLHAWWGLNDTIKRLCVSLADAGYIAFAPDLYHGNIADTIPGAESLCSALFANNEQASAEVAEAARFLSERSGKPANGLAVIGFSLGASYAIDLASANPEQIRSVVLFYGTGDADLSRSKASYLGHFAENDDYEPQSSVDGQEEALRKAGRPVTFYRYEGAGHWFFEPDRTDAFDEAAAELAWERTLDFLERNQQ